MVGELPEDFLRVPVDASQAQVMADERVARLVQVQQQGGFVAIPANTVGRLTITLAQVYIIHLFLCVMNNNKKNINTHLFRGCKIDRFILKNMGAAIIDF